MQVGRLGKKLFMGGLGIVPHAEEVDVAADLLAPLAVVVGGPRKRR
jgi:hypothetical protein